MQTIIKKNLLGCSGVIAVMTLVSVLFNGNFKDWKTRCGLVLGGGIVTFLGTVAGCGLAGAMNIPFNVATGESIEFSVTFMSLSRKFY